MNVSQGRDCYFLVPQIHWRRNHVKMEELQALEIENRYAREDVHWLLINFVYVTQHSHIYFK